MRSTKRWFGDWNDSEGPSSTADYLSSVMVSALHAGHVAPLLQQLLDTLLLLCGVGPAFLSSLRCAAEAAMCRALPGEHKKPEAPDHWALSSPVGVQVLMYMQGSCK